MKELLRSLIRRLGYEVKRIPKGCNAHAVGPLLDTLRRYDEQQAFRTILDVGANIGQTTKRYISWFPDARVYSIEPHDAAYDELKRLAQHHRVTACHTALGDSTGKTHLFVNKCSQTNSLLPASLSANDTLQGDLCENVGRQPVQVTRLDEFCQKHHIQRIDLLKIDTQGYENHVLTGAGEMLTPARIRLIYIEISFVQLYDEQAHFDELYRLLWTSGYKLYGFYDTWARFDVGYMWTDALFVPLADGDKVIPAPGTFAGAG